MRIVQPNSWTPSDGIQMENAADKAIRYDGNVCIMAGPGAGKTELLAQKAAYLFATNKCKFPQKILAICFKNDAADNLKKRIVSRCGQEVASRFISLTYDAFAKSIVDHFRMALPKELVPTTNYIVNDWNIVGNAFLKAGFANVDALRGRSLQQYLEGELDKVQLPLSEDSVRAKALKLLIHGFDENKPCLTFKIIAMLAKYIVDTNPLIKKAIQATYSHVFLDEFQDTTGLQYAFMKSCFLNSKSKLTAVGDNKQRIMLWAGALKTVFDNFCEEFSAKKLHLIMNHRSAPRLVSLQQSMYASLDDSNREVQLADKWRADEGEIVLYVAKDETAEAQGIANDIKQKIESGIQPNDICVLCKQLPQNYTQTIINVLADYGIRARIENNYQDLIKGPVVEIINAILRLCINKQNPQEWEFVDVFLSELNGIDDRDANVTNITMQTQFVQVLDELANYIKELNSLDELETLLERIMKYIGKERLKSYYPRYSHTSFLDDCLNSFTQLLHNELEYVKWNWELAIDNFVGKNSIPIMTIHKSKGLEYSAVYFIGLEDSAFWNFKNQPEEDRCAFFVALSRAKTSVAFSFCKERSATRLTSQTHNEINEFFELLQSPNMAKIVEL